MHLEKNSFASVELPPKCNLTLRPLQEVCCRGVALKQLRFQKSASCSTRQCTWIYYSSCIIFLDFPVQFNSLELQATLWEELQQKDKNWYCRWSYEPQFKGKAQNFDMGVESLAGLESPKKSQCLAMQN